ncbi:MAG: hypothetical protein F9K09_01710 [Flavobacteriales bacterium]|nr:MAG: hypothetical protein F9K09_01710 [Flavobacteriales bacterium]
MKKIMLTLLLFVFIFPVVGQEIDSVKTIKNQIDLDIHFLALEGTYKKRISKKIFFGFSFGGGPLFRVNFTGDGGFIEWVKFKSLLDYQLAKRIHIYQGFSYSTTYAFEGDVGGKSIGVEIGFFYQIWKIELGFEPSLIIFQTSGIDEKFKTGEFTTTLLIMKIPLSRW